MRPLLFALPFLLLALPAAAQPFRFAALGDFPYCESAAPDRCADELDRTEALVEAVNAAAPAFSIFLGDTKGGNEACGAPLLLRAEAWFARFRGPLIYTPGDNEWTDCWQWRAGGYDPLAALRLLRERFFAAPRSLGGAALPLLRQADIDPAHRAYVENARWSRGGVIFATVHVPGSDNNRPLGRGDAPPGAAREYPARDRANLAWIAATFDAAAREGARAAVIALQSDLYYRDRCGRGTVEGHLATRQALAEGARRFARPVLLLHGDSHFFLDDRPVPDAPNLRRIMVPGAADIRAVLIAVEPDAAEPFQPTLIGRDDRAAGPSC